HKALASTKETQADVDVDNAAPLQVVAVKQAHRPQLPPITGLNGHRGRLHWQEDHDFFCDHYQVDVFAGSNGLKPLHSLTVREARADRPSNLGRPAVWCRVAACDGAGGRGPW
ncbi:MAG: hypothetical protein M3Y56_15365, partial [Armatimonadota bacterium]|nr:hypothetical protein [Armatimonadota bacterium]